MRVTRHLQRWGVLDRFYAGGAAPIHKMQVFHGTRGLLMEAPLADPAMCRGYELGSAPGRSGGTAESYGWLVRPLGAAVGSAPGGRSGGPDSRTSLAMRG